MTELKALSIAGADDSEEIARAELYGLLSRLWVAPPDDDLLAQFRVAVTDAPQPGGFLEAPWQALVSAMRDTTIPQSEPPSTSTASTRAGHPSARRPARPCVVRAASSSG